MATVRIKQTTKEKIEKIAREKAKSLAIEAREKLTKKYLSLIAEFYSEYTPVFCGYARHFNNDYSDVGLFKSGLGHTFTKYYKNQHKNKYSGGIFISTQNMFDDYRGTTAQVLETFVSMEHKYSFHGVPRHFMRSNIIPSPYTVMLEYKDELIKELSGKKTIR